jgi:hypothetical protein
VRQWNEAEAEANLIAFSSDPEETREREARKAIFTHSIRSIGTENDDEDETAGVPNRKMSVRFLQAVDVSRN